MRAAGRQAAWAAGGGLLLALACLALDPEQKCNRTQYEAHGKCCSRCPPGQRVSVPCSNDSDTACASCRPQHFQNGWTKQTVCTPHRYCDQNAGLVVHIQGSAEQNVVCRCRNGTHCSSRECQSCRENKVCQEGEGAQQTATDTTDTVCAECPVGFFSNISSATASCQPWSSCWAAGLVHKTDGTRSTDVVCEEAHRSRSLALALVPLAAVIVVLGGLGLLLWRRRLHRRELQKQQKNQPAEDDFEEDKGCPALPVQETLPMTQEAEGKDSRLAEQEHA
ncbi:tumor necrosis factor receptor superfamily member 5 [Eublepharis macularius]|uniref:Tumor necrosis factor receptor superfamily member 5 n=1 Tax=Eublepharis macularius TaxID=481883 RepID=A0AA97JB55_EUBMA|nr:tumor necrosis factor receptor superfamily member 5 [Eublepharis macularius]